MTLLIGSSTNSELRANRNNNTTTMLDDEGWQEGGNNDENHQMASNSFACANQFPADLIPLLYPNVNESETPLPRAWSSKDKFNFLGLSQDRLTVNYKGIGKTHKDAASIRTPYPIPATCGLYYYEVRIVSKGRDGYMGIGFSSQAVSMNRLPGWDKHSYGYHGDDGRSFCCSGTGQPYGPTFTTGDIIGCGINTADNYCFYTKNGVDLGIAFYDIPPNLYPTVGLQTLGETIQANFGQVPFAFDIFDKISCLRQKVFTSILGLDASKALHLNSIPISLNHNNTNQNITPPWKNLTTSSNWNLNNSKNAKNINNLDWGTILQRITYDYLMHQGYIKTAQSFLRNLNASLTNSKSDDIDVENRKKIQNLVLGGQIGAALGECNNKYPAIFLQHILDMDNVNIIRNNSIIKTPKQVSSAHTSSLTAADDSDKTPNGENSNLNLNCDSNLENLNLKYLLFRLRCRRFIEMMSGSEEQKVGERNGETLNVDNFQDTTKLETNSKPLQRKQSDKAIETLNCNTMFDSANCNIDGVMIGNMNNNVLNSNSIFGSNNIESTLQHTHHMTLPSIINNPNINNRNNNNNFGLVDSDVDDDDDIIEVDCCDISFSGPEDSFINNNNVTINDNCVTNNDGDNNCVTNNDEGNGFFSENNPTCTCQCCTTRHKYCCQPLLLTNVTNNENINVTNNENINVTNNENINVTINNDENEDLCLNCPQCKIVCDHQDYEHSDTSSCFCEECDNINRAGEICPLCCQQSVDLRSKNDAINTNNNLVCIECLKEQQNGSKNSNSQCLRDRRHRKKHNNQIRDDCISVNSNTSSYNTNAHQAHLIDTYNETNNDNNNKNNVHMYEDENDQSDDSSLLSSRDDDSYSGKAADDMNECGNSGGGGYNSINSCSSTPYGEDYMGSTSDIENMENKMNMPNASNGNNCYRNGKRLPLSIEAILEYGRALRLQAEALKGEVQTLKNLANNTLENIDDNKTLNEKQPKEKSSTNSKTPAINDKNLGEFANKGHQLKQSTLIIPYTADEIDRQLQDAFSVLAYSNPWESIIKGILDPLNREPLALQLNSIILELQGKRPRSTLEIAIGQASKCLKLMSRNNMGQCGFVALSDFLPK